jgi:hypothetical protein
MALFNAASTSITGGRLKKQSLLFSCFQVIVALYLPFVHGIPATVAPSQDVDLCCRAYLAFCSPIFPQAPSKRDKQEASSVKPLITALGQALIKRECFLMFVPLFLTCSCHSYPRTHRTADPNLTATLVKAALQDNAPASFNARVMALLALRAAQKSKPSNVHVYARLFLFFLGKSLTAAPMDALPELPDSTNVVSQLLKATEGSELIIPHSFLALFALELASNLPPMTGVRSFVCMCLCVCVCVCVCVCKCRWASLLHKVSL